MSNALRGGLSRLDVTTKVTLAILALASGVYTYLGVRELLNGSADVVFVGAVIYSTAVSVGIYAFWSYLIRFFPHVVDVRSRILLLGAMALGSAMIVAMSSWLNAAALAGGAALEQHLALTTENYQQKLEQAHENALAAQSLLPDIQLASQRFSRLAQEEQASGALTGTSGSGTVVQLLSQMSGQLLGLSSEIEASREETQALYKQGSTHLGAMRKIVSSPGEISPRSNAFADEAVALSGVIAAIQQTSVAPSVKRAADDLGRSFIAPVADGQSAELATRQREVVGRVETAVQQQSAALSQAAQSIMDRPVVVPVRFTPISTPEAVLRYAGDFLPSWAGAISIDLMPAALILILAVVQSVIRRESESSTDADMVTAADMMRAVRLHRELVEMEKAEEAVVLKRSSVEPSAATSDAEDANKHKPTGNVTALSASGGSKSGI